MVKSLPPSTSYCASFDVKHSGVNGYFAMTIDEQTGLSYYDFKVDLTQYPNPSKCNLNNKLKYHIHSYWTNTTSTNTYVISTCGATGGHFDPYLACSQSSQYQTSPATYPGPLCPLLNRVAPNYTYPCSATNFNGGNLQGCEVGDLSGKFGLISNTSYGIYESSSISGPVLIDPLGPAIMDYGNDLPQTVTSYTNMWNSIVFHCNDATNTRLFCAQFLSSNVDTCVAQGAAFNPTSTEATTTKTVSTKTFNLSVALGVTLAFIFGAISSFFFTTYRLKSMRNSEKGVNDPLIQNY